jgi:trans-aconitate methyltransferase
MPDPVRALYQSAPYPAVSHPATDPAVTTVTARLAGLDVPPPSHARILDIGCAAGHNLLPLAARWPESRFTGVDFCDAAIGEARETARLAGLKNVEFHRANLLDFDPGEGVEYDCIIAHGFYSWVPTNVRQALLDFCQSRLSHHGVALISYNTLPGWSLRKSIVELTRTLTKSPGELFGKEPEEVLGLLATAAGNHNPYARYLTTVLHDMFGKTDNTLMFDDFGPINEPRTFLDFTAHAADSGLRYLGESQLAENFPATLSNDSWKILKPLAADAPALQQMIDVLTNRTFRSSLLCRDDARLEEKVTLGVLADLSIRTPHAVERTGGGICLVNRAGEKVACFDHPLTVAFFTALVDTGPESVPVHEIAARMTSNDGEILLPTLVGLMMDLAKKGLILLRAEPVRFSSTPPEFPDLGPLRLSAARRGQALTDIYHAPYGPDEARRQILIHMDGTRSVDELSAVAEIHAPRLDFNAWLGYLSSRGMFAR